MFLHEVIIPVLLQIVGAFALRWYVLFTLSRYFVFLFIFAWVVVWDMAFVRPFFLVLGWYFAPRLFLWLEWFSIPVLSFAPLPVEVFEFPWIVDLEVLPNGTPCTVQGAPNSTGERIGMRVASGGSVTDLRTYEWERSLRQR